MKHTILHVDANAFYCSCHQAEDPSLRNLPLAVGGKQREDSIRTPILVTASYEARRINPSVQAGMTVPEAKRLIPSLQIIPPDFTLYHRYSEQLFQILSSFSPVVEKVSIDEGFLDLRGISQFGDSLAAAYLIKDTVKQTLGIPVSIGVSSNKLLAKMASNMRKPDQVTVITAEDVQKKLWPKSVRELHGCGDKTASRLERLRIWTIGDLASCKLDWLLSHFGKSQGTYLYQSSRGIGSENVNPDRGTLSKTISHSTTLPQDQEEPEILRRYLLKLSEEVASRSRAQRLMARTVTLTIRNANLQNQNRSKTLRSPTADSSEIYKTLCELFNTSWNLQPVRLLGVSLSNLITEPETLAIQLDLFSPVAEDNYQSIPEKRKKLIHALDQLQSKYGTSTITRASLLSSTRSDSAPKSAAVPSKSKKDPHVES